MTDATERPGESSSGAGGAVLTALVMTAVVCNLNIAGATVALPDIGAAFQAEQSMLNLVGVGAGLGMSMSVLYSGAVADRYGRKQLLMLGLVLTAVASIVSAFAPTIEALIAARVFTGVAAGMAYPTTLSLITALWPQGPRRTGAIAIWSSVGAMASVCGGVIVGALLLWLWWGSAFLLSVPVAILALVLVIRYVPSHVGESQGSVDHLGGALSVLGVASLVLSVSLVFAPGGRELGLILLAAAVVLLAAFILRQRKARNPLFDLQVAGRRTFWAPALAGAVAFGALVGGMFVGEQFMQNVLGYTALGAGLAVIPAAVGLVAMAPVSARLVLRSGTRATMLVGYGFLLVAFLTMLGWREGAPYALIGAGFLIIGAGASFVLTAASRSLTSSTPVRRVGMASATSDLQGDLGGSIMQALLGAILATGFAKSFADLVAQSPEASSVTDDVMRALQASYASALHVASQTPEFHDQIVEAARQSLVDGALMAYLIGAVAIVAGALVVLFAIPSRSSEIELFAGYERDQSAPPAANVATPVS